MPLESLLTNPNPVVPRSRSILSRISSPLSKHSRNVFELSIEPDDPWKTYFPGEAVKGNIILTALKGFDVTHLVIALQGYAQVWKHNNGDEDFPVANVIVNGKGSRGYEYHGDGLASLFRDEQVLCGEGFLKRQIYKFGFELRFPTQNMPSDIEFERGTISYMITATLTRPTAIAPATTICKKIRYKDCVDIESMYTPKSRVISLEPVSRRGKVKKVKQASSVGTQETSSRGELTRNNTLSSIGSRPAVNVNNPPLSPAPSEGTGTNTSASEHSGPIADAESPNRKQSPQTSDTRSTTTSSSNNTITATVHISRHGVLPGDTLPIRVTVQHTKHRARGIVIATLYRQGRIDMHPPIPVVSKSKDKRAEYEDVYPRSRTGLGGLYFANNSPSSVYRKDIAQSYTMMIVNPQTLQADIQTSIKIPETFPTIANVPGAMIAFTYHVEVVIDLFGKLNETKPWPRLTSDNETMFAQAGSHRSQLTTEWSNNILDTTQLRRAKSVVTTDIHVVVGTLDSSRKKMSNESDIVGSHDQLDQYYPENGEGYDHDEQAYHDYQYYHYYYNDGYYPHGEENYHDYNYDYDYFPDGNHVPPPQPEEQVDEKTRLKRQEQLLLPSQPPQEGESSRNRVTFAPTAPVLSSLEPPVDTNPSINGHPPHSNHGASSVASVQSADTIRAPSTSPPPMPITSNVHASDDKQELERQRLLSQASAPTDDDGAGPSAGHGHAALAPSAPVINEEDEYTAQTLNHHPEDLGLPQYQS